MTIFVLLICMSAFLDCHLTLKCRSHSQERTSALDFKGTSASRFGDSNAVFLSIFSDEHQKVLAVNHR